MSVFVSLKTDETLRLPGCKANQTYLVYVVCYFEHSGLHSPDTAKLLVLKKKRQI